MGVQVWNKHIRLLLNLNLICTIIIVKKSAYRLPWQTITTDQIGMLLFFPGHAFTSGISDDRQCPQPEMSTRNNSISWIFIGIFYIKLEISSWNS